MYGDVKNMVQTLSSQNRTCKRNSASETERTKTIPDGNTASVLLEVQTPDDNAVAVPIEDVLVPEDNVTSSPAGRSSVSGCG